MSDKSVSQHRVQGFVHGADWRETKFAQPVPSHLTCELCGVISRATFLLPCYHNLCESCGIHSVTDGDIVCPFDDEPFSVGDCRQFYWTQDAAEELKACCWNEAHGCPFVGTLEAVLAHYERKCAFHAVTCPRCNAPVLQQDIPRHYRAGCHGAAVPEAAGVCVSLEDIGRSSDDLN